MILKRKYGKIFGGILMEKLMINSFKSNAK